LPVSFQDVDTDLAGWTNIGVEYFGEKVAFRGCRGEFWAEVEFHLENAILIRSSSWTFIFSLDISEVFFIDDDL
jgi:hypothetical protein